MNDKVKIFISYARVDAEPVAEIYRRLKAAGFDPWIDSEDMLPGVKWKDAIVKAVRERGGSWHNVALGCRSANRSYGSPDSRNDGLGFRLVRIGR